MQQWIDRVHYDECSNRAQTTYLIQNIHNCYWQLHLIAHKSTIETQSIMKYGGQMLVMYYFVWRMEGPGLRDGCRLALKT